MPRQFPLVLGNEGVRSESLTNASQPLGRRRPGLLVLDDFSRHIIQCKFFSEPKIDVARA